MEDKKQSYQGTKIKAKPIAEPNTGIDTDNTLFANILNAADGSTLDMTTLETFLNVSQSREVIYKLIDSMTQDSTIASILETYAEDAVEPNDEGQIVWAESADGDVSKYVNFLLDAINVDKQVYNWVYSLIKYGDIYLRLYRESDYKDDELFGEEKDDKKSLNEDVILKGYSKSDHYVHYIEKISNPGEMYELTRHGKSMGYIKAPTRLQDPNRNDFFGTSLANQTFYKMRKSDVEIYQATDYVHASLEDNSNRTPEEVQIFLDNDTNSDRSITYTVKRGQSILYNAFRIWRELSLLKNSVLLNRVTKSSIVRIIQVEVGTMGKEEVGPHLQQIKQLIEQKSAINAEQGMSEYTNPGPVENNIYVATHDGKGAISTTQVGGDVDVKSLADVDMFSNDLFAALRVPKQFFGQTDDSAGFNGGSSLSIISSRYGKAVKRIQNTIIQAIQDAINLMLLDKGLNNYINKFQIRMQAPITQEEIDRRDATSNKLRVVSDIMAQIDLNDPTAKLKIVKSLLSSAITDTEVIEILQDEIDKMVEQQKAEEEKGKKDNSDSEIAGDNLNLSNNAPAHIDDEPIDNNFQIDDIFSDESETAEPEQQNLNADDSYLETPNELGVDMTQNV